MQRFESYYFGKIPYSAGISLQDEQVETVRKTEVAQLLGFEHPAVITLGKRGDLEKDLKSSLSEVENQGIEVLRVDRGGEATLHSPGQLVLYPLIPLRKWDLGVREFVEGLIKITQKTLQDFGIETITKDPSEPGLYTRNGKIAFFGIRVDRGISTHGISINVQNDLKKFDHIISCGVSQEKFDRVKNYADCITPLNVFDSWTTHFRQHFDSTPSSQTKATMHQVTY